MNGKLAWMAKGEGFAVIGLVLFGGLGLLLGIHLLTGAEFVSAFQVLVVSYFGGGAAAAFRDFKKGVSSGG